MFPPFFAIYLLGGRSMAQLGSARLHPGTLHQSDISRVVSFSLFFSLLSRPPRLIVDGQHFFLC